MTTKKNENIESEYFEDVTLTDPITGKTFTQKVKIVRYKTPEVKNRSVAEELEDDSPAPLPEEDNEDQE